MGFDPEGDTPLEPPHFHITPTPLPHSPSLGESIVEHLVEEIEEQTRPLVCRVGRRTES